MDGQMITTPHSAGRRSRAPGSAAAGKGAAAGSALIIVLWVTGLLAMFVAGFAFDMQIEARIASASRKKLKAEYLARGGYALARMALMETLDGDVNNPDRTVYMGKGNDAQLRNGVIALAQGGGADFSRELDGGGISVSIQPENASMNVNSLIFAGDRQKTYEAWKDLFDIADVPFENRDALVDCLVDWVDENDLTQINGAESEYYESLDPPYSAYNGPIAAVEDLMLVKGFAERMPETGITIYDSVAGYLTTYADNEKININAAAEETLIAFFGMDRQIAEAIVSERRGADGLEGTEDDKPFKDINDLLSRVPVLDPGIGAHLTFTAAGRFRVRIAGQVGNLTHSVVCVLQLADKKLKVLHWFEGEQEKTPVVPAAAEMP